MKIGTRRPVKKQAHRKTRYNEVRKRPRRNGTVATFTELTRAAKQGLTIKTTHRAEDGTLEQFPIAPGDTVLELARHDQYIQQLSPEVRSRRGKPSSRAKPLDSSPDRKIQQHLTSHRVIVDYDAFISVYNPDYTPDLAANTPPRPSLDIVLTWYAEGCGEGRQAHHYQISNYSLPETDQQQITDLLERKWYRYHLFKAGVPPGQFADSLNQYWPESLLLERERFAARYITDCLLSAIGTTAVRVLNESLLYDLTTDKDFDTLLELEMSEEAQRLAKNLGIYDKRTLPRRDQLHNQRLLERYEYLLIEIATSIRKTYLQGKTNCLGERRSQGLLQNAQKERWKRQWESICEQNFPFLEASIFFSVMEDNEEASHRTPTPKQIAFAYVSKEQRITKAKLHKALTAARKKRKQLGPTAPTGP